MISFYGIDDLGFFDLRPLEELQERATQNREQQEALSLLSRAQARGGSVRNDESRVALCD